MKKKAVIKIFLLVIAIIVILLIIFRSAILTKVFPPAPEIAKNDETFFVI